MTGRPDWGPWAAGTTGQDGRPGAARDFSPRFEQTIPLAHRFRYLHEPAVFIDGDSWQNETVKARFVGRERELRELAERILLSHGGAFLITGYRGVGKTSFVNRVIQEIKDAQTWLGDQAGPLDVLDIYLNLARPLTAGELMHHIIRSLYSRLQERKLLALFDRETQEALLLAFQRTSYNMTRKTGSAAENNFGISDLTLGIRMLGISPKLSLSGKRTRSENLDLSFLAFDDKAAEYDIMQLSARLQMGYRPQAPWWVRAKRWLRREQPPRVALKIIYVFDELDKLEDFTPPNGKPVIDEILGALKNLFTMSGLTFVFVAGKDLQERWLEETGRGDSIFESVFAFHKYLPALWQDVGRICDHWLQGPAPAEAGGEPGAAGRPPLPLASPQRETYEAFVRYLAFLGRGMPRRILRNFNQYVHLGSQYPYLGFDRRDLRRIRFYAQLQAALEDEEQRLVGEVAEETVGERQDKRRLAIYYLIDWVLQRGDLAFTPREVAAACRQLSAKIAPAEDAIEGLVAALIEALLEAQYLEKVELSPDQALVGKPTADGDGRYRLPRRRIVEMGSLLDTLVEGSGVVRPPAESNRATIGRYQVLDKLGVGGMSVVYRAWDPVEERYVALKVLTLNDPGLKQRFEREGRLLAGLRHPNIVPCYEFGDDGQPFIAMKYIEGISLHAMLARTGRLDPAVARAVFEPLAQAVSYLHGRGIVRCDLKPGNVLMERSGTLYLVDLGIAKARVGDVAQTATGIFIGTPIYMAPEQARGAGVDARADIYSLGIMLYEMLTGRVPFIHDDIFAVLRAHLQEAPRPPHELAPSIPPEVEAAILRCLEKDPAQRFQTVEELLAALPPGAPASLADVVRSALQREEKLSAREDEATQVVAPTDVVPRPVESAPPVTTAWASGPPQAGAVPPLPVGVAELLGLAGPFAGRQLALAVAGRTRLGRSADNEISIDDSALSRYHTEISALAGVFTVTDLNTLNGTYLNGRRIGQEILRDGDRIRLGSSEFQFAVTATWAGSAMPEPPATVIEPWAALPDEAPTMLLMDPGDVLTARFAAPPVPPGPGAWLSVINRPQDTVFRFPLPDPVASIGRARRNTVILDDACCSRLHARIERLHARIAYDPSQTGDGEAVVLYDLASANGTFVQGERTMRTELHDGDVVQIGQTLLVYQIAAGPDTLPPAGATAGDQVEPRAKGADET